MNSFEFYNFHGIRAAYIHVSDVCNFKCKTCELPKDRKKVFVPTTEIFKKIDKAISLNLKNLCFTGQEVILHPDIDKIIQYSFEQGALYITFNTNGLAFCSDNVLKKLKKVRKFMDRVFIAVSINFYNEKTFAEWSGHKEVVFKKWCQSFKDILKSNLNISSIDIILKNDSDIIKILDFLLEVSNNKLDYSEGVRIIDLMPFGCTTEDLYRELKFSLTESKDLIKKIIQKYPGKINFEGFPICVFDQKELKENKYYIFNFYLNVENGLITQYDPNIYETFYEGNTENWEISLEKALKAYGKMFCYSGECQGCYYKNKCYGIQREYLKYSTKSDVNEEIKKLKEINWK